MTEYRIRRATRADAPDFLRLVTELARFEKLEPPTSAARRRLVADGFGPARRFDVFLARHEASKTTVGYAIVLETYSSFLARPTLYLEDVYLRPEHRGTGLGEAMMTRLAADALARGCGRLEGIVLDWNARARRFYQRLGGRELDDWCFFRFDARALRALARPRTVKRIGGKRGKRPGLSA